MDSSLIRTSISSISILKRWQASINSKPLFTIVAESIVILFPIFQVGWFNTSSLVTYLSFSLGSSLKDPPEAVIITLSISSKEECLKSLCKATCSESIGNSLPLDFFNTSLIISPPITRDSLLAKQRSISNFKVSTEDKKPASPTKALTTLSKAFFLTNSKEQLSPEITSYSSCSFLNSNATFSSSIATYLRLGR